MPSRPLPHACETARTRCRPQPPGPSTATTPGGSGHHDVPLVEHLHTDRATAHVDPNLDLTVPVAHGVGDQLTGDQHQVVPHGRTRRLHHGRDEQPGVRDLGEIPLEAMDADHVAVPTRGCKDGAMASPLEIVIEGTAEDPILVLQGEIDVASVVGLRTAVDELPRPPDHMIIDLGGVTFMDSTGLGWLAALAKGGCAVALRDTPETIRKLLDVTGVGAIVSLLEPDDLNQGDLPPCRSPSPMTTAPWPTPPPTSWPSRTPAARPAPSSRRPPRSCPPSGRR